LTAEPDKNYGIIVNPLVRTQMEAGVSPLLSSIEDAIEAIFLTAHKEDFSMEAESKQVPPSFPQYSGVY
jgi:hypothetical protein